MDWKLMKRLCLQWLGKYKYVVAVLILGLILMNLPPSGTSAPTQPMEEQAVKQDVSEELEQILSRIEGVGRVEVMLTESEGEQIHYQTDLDETDSTDTQSRREKTVLYSEGNKEAGLIKSVTPPVYLGAIIVCEGGGNPAVVLSVVNAVRNVTGISSDRISVMKMK